MRRYQGLPASAGIVIGPAWIYHPVKVTVKVERVQDSEAEWVRLNAAANLARNQLQALEERARANIGEAEAAIFQAHQEFLDDVEIMGSIHKMISEQHVSAEMAVKANFDRVRNPENKLRRYTLYKIISQIDVLDDYTVRFTLSEPFGAMIATFAHPAGGINSPAAVQKYGQDYEKNPVGTGPYKFQEWVPNDHITLVKNADYWDKANEAKVDKIIIKPVPEEGTRIAMLQKGDAQFINFVPYIQADVVKADRNLSLASTEAIYTFWVAMNVQKKPFNDLRVRQAMNYAMDKQAVIKAVLRGQGKPADSPLAPRVWGYTPVKTYPYDLAKAKALLAEAGYPNGFKAVLRGNNQTDTKDAMVAIQGQLKQVGVDVEVLALPAAALSAERFLPPAENKGEMDFAGWSPSTGDADWGIRPLLTKENWPPTNFTIGFYTNPKVEAAIKAGLETADAAKRKAAYAEAQRAIMDDCPWIFLWVNNLLGGSRANVGGISLQPDAIGFYRSVYYK